MPTQRLNKWISAFAIVLIMVPSFAFLSPKQADAFGYGGSAGGNLQIGGVGSVLLSCSGLGDKIGSFFSKLTSKLNSDSVTVNDTEANHRENCLKAVAQYLSKVALAKMTNETVNWINTGFKGSPLFVQSWTTFSKSIRDAEIEDFTNSIAFDAHLYPFGRSTAISLIAQNAQNYFATNAQYTLDNYIAANNPGKTSIDFSTDFSAGGWNSFLYATQLPQNNPIGFSMIATDELATHIAGTAASKAEVIKDQLFQGNGFLSLQECVDPGPLPKDADAKVRAAEDRLHELQGAAEGEGGNPNPLWYYDLYDPNGNTGDVLSTQSFSTLSACTAGIAAWQAANPGNSYISDSCYQKDISGHATGGYNPSGVATGYDAQIKQQQDIIAANTCKNYETRTPGQVISNQLTSALNIKRDSLISSTDINNSLSAVFDALMNQLVTKGLTSLTNVAPNIDRTGNFGGYGLNTTRSNSGAGSYQNAYASQDVNLARDLPYIIYLQQRFIGDPSAVLPIAYHTVISGSGGTGAQQAAKLVPLFTDPAPGFGGAPALLDTIAKTIYDIKVLDYCVPGPRPTWQSDVSASIDSLLGKLQNRLEQKSDNVGNTVLSISDSIAFGIPGALIDAFNGTADDKLSTLGSTLNEAFNEYSARITAIPYHKVLKEKNNSNNDIVVDINMGDSGYTLANLPLVASEASAEYNKLPQYQQTVTDLSDKVNTLKTSINALKRLLNEVTALAANATIDATERARLNESYKNTFYDLAPNLVDAGAFQTLEQQVTEFNSADQNDVDLLKQCSVEIADWGDDATDNAHGSVLPQLRALNIDNWLPYPGIWEYSQALNSGKNDDLGWQIRTVVKTPDSDPAHLYIPRGQPNTTILDGVGFTETCDHARLTYADPTGTWACPHQAGAENHWVVITPNPYPGVNLPWPKTKPAQADGTHEGFTFLPRETKSPLEDPQHPDAEVNFWSVFMIGTHGPHINEKMWHLHDWFAEFEQNLNIY